MGEARRKLSATQRMIEAHPNCALDGGIRPTETREHFPPTNFFDRFHRPERFVVPACSICNRESAIADLVAGIVSRIGFGPPTAQESEDLRKLFRKLHKLRPELVSQMLKVDPSAKTRAFIQYRAHGLNVPERSDAFAITGDAFQYLHLFAHKAVLCHYFNLANRPLPKGGGVLAFLRPKETVALGALPPEVLGLLGPVAAIAQGRKRYQDEYEFRESYGAADGVYAVACRFRKGFFVFGLAVEDIQKIDADTRRGFLSPPAMLSILGNSQYKRLEPTVPDEAQESVAQASI
jgi:hypothetical protein